MAAAHPPRPPIPMRALDEAAMAAARDRGASEPDVWLAGAAGDPQPARTERAVDVAPRFAGGSPLSVAEVAAAVDRGRDQAAAAARDRVTILRALEPLGADRSAAGRVAGWTLDAGDVGPLGALRRLGDEELAVLCGAALGAGEHGLAYVYDGLAGEVAAAIAVAVEPDVAPRIRPAAAA